MLYDIIIIGGGPAGLTAAVYARRSGRSVLVLEKDAFGGQISWSPRVENFPGFVSVSGTELGDKLLEQAMEQGAEAELEEAVQVLDENGVKTVVTASGLRYSARALIVAAGARPRQLGLPREEELTGSGVCYCALCDGAFYKGRPVAVAGGGSSALQDALYLSALCSHVTLIHRRSAFRGGGFGRKGQRDLPDGVRRHGAARGRGAHRRARVAGGRGAGPACGGALCGRGPQAGQRRVRAADGPGPGGLCRRRGGLPDPDARRLCGRGLPGQAGPPADHRRRRRRRGGSRRLRLSGQVIKESADKTTRQRAAAKQHFAAAQTVDKLYASEKNERAAGVREGARPLLAFQ